MRVTGYQEKLFFPVLLSVFMAACSAVEAIDSVVPDQASDASSHGNTKEANASQQDANATESSDWLKYATKSYSLWRKGNMLQAMEQGEKAAQLNPTSAVVLINLALMKQSSNLYNDAITLYRRAGEIAPQNWVPPLGIARCYIMAGDLWKGRSALHTMSDQNGCNFDWYYMAAKTWLEIEDSDMAEKSASKAVRAASTREQKSAAEDLLFLTRLRSAKFEEAESMREQVFHNNLPRDGEIYVRAVASLLPVNDPDAGRDTLNCALKCLNGEQYADAFFKLGRVFEDKAADPTCDPEDRKSWLESAQAAYDEAIKLDPKRGDYHFALASAFNMVGAMTNAVDELKKSVSLDKRDILSPFLVAKILKPPTSSREGAIPLNLSLVKFKINGLTCSCKLSRVYGALRSVDGVIFISTPPEKPYMGLVLIDHSLTPVKEMIEKCNKSTFLTGDDPKTAPLNISLEMVSEEAVSNINSAMKVASDVKFGSVLSFQKTYSDYLNRFKEISPIMPVSATSGVQTATSWSAPL
jgi:tetratricopeptide (TPR) repeat protein